MKRRRYFIVFYTTLNSRGERVFYDGDCITYAPMNDPKKGAPYISSVKFAIDQGAYLGVPWKTIDITNVNEVTFEDFMDWNKK